MEACDNIMCIFGARKKGAQEKRDLEKRGLRKKGPRKKGAHFFSFLIKQH